MLFSVQQQIERVALTLLSVLADHISTTETLDCGQQRELNGSQLHTFSVPNLRASSSSFKSTSCVRRPH